MKLILRSCSPETNKKSQQLLETLKMDVAINLSHKSRQFVAQYSKDQFCGSGC